MRAIAVVGVVGMVCGLAGFGLAADGEKKPKKPDGEKPAVKAMKVVGEIKAIDGNKVTIALPAAGDGGKKKPAGAVEFTADDKTRIQTETGKDVATTNPKGKPLTAPERADAKLSDLKVGAKVSGVATADKVLLQLVQLRPAKEADKKPDGDK